MLILNKKLVKMLEKKLFFIIIFLLFVKLKVSFPPFIHQEIQ
jgi:hypothetical protein